MDKIGQEFQIVKRICFLLIGTLLLNFFVFKTSTLAYSVACDPPSAIRTCSENPDTKGSQLCEGATSSCSFFCAQPYSGNQCNSEYVMPCSTYCADSYWVCCGTKYCIPETYEKTITQRVVQYRCTPGGSFGNCGGTIEFKRRTAERQCKKICQVNANCVESCGSWTCDPWVFKDETTIKTYSTQNQPWLVCTYKYEALTEEEKQRAGIQKAKISCDENECRLEEVTWFPPVKDTDSKEYFEQKIQGKDLRFFDIAQIACWGGCLRSIEGKAHYFGGSINPARSVGEGKIEGEEQSPDRVRLPVKLGWEFDKEKWGVDEWEKAIKWAREQCREGLERRDSRGRSCLYFQPPDKNSIKNILINEFWGGRDLFKIEVISDHSFSRDLGVGSFYIKAPVERFLPVYEGQNIPDWQTPASENRDMEWGRKEMYDYFDYYFLNNTAYNETPLRFGFSGYFERGGRKYYLYVYSPSQDSKSDYLWVEYKDPNKNYLTKQIRIEKGQTTHGPCKIAPFQSHSLVIYPCCGIDRNNCSPENPRGEGWTFRTVGPEIKSILGIKIERFSRVFPFSLNIFNSEREYYLSLLGNNKVEGKIYRFIDVDWDRVWPSKVKKLDNETRFGSCGSSRDRIYDQSFIGFVKFSKDANPRDPCKEECWRRCDAACLRPCTCEREYRENCEAMCDAAKNERKISDEDLRKCKEDCQRMARDHFNKIRREGCPNCKSSEKALGCIVCRSCEARPECKEECIETCHQQRKNSGNVRWVEELEECDEVCARGYKYEGVDIDLIAARNECSAIEDEKLKMICRKCQQCNYHADFFDVEWCPIEREGVVVTSIHYKGREDAINFPLKEAFKKINEWEVPKTCEDNNAQSICAKKPCEECFEYNQANGEEIYKRENCKVPCIKDIFIPHPLNRAWSGLKFQCKTIPSENEKECSGIPPLNFYDLPSSELGIESSLRGFIEKLRIVKDAYEQYGELQNTQKNFWIPISLYGGAISPKQNWLEQDKAIFLVSSFIPISIQLGLCPQILATTTECLGSSIRWDFQLQTLPKKQLCNFEKANCFGEIEERYPFCYPIDKRTTSLEQTPEKFIDNGKVGFNRILNILVPPDFDRVFSIRLKIKDFLGNFVKLLPKRSTQSNYGAEEFETGTFRKSPINFQFYDVWNALPPLQDALARLGKEYTLLFFPCWDELGFYCAEEPIEQRIKIAKEPPSYPFQEQDSGPPPPRKIRVPHVFNWDPALGAAAYWLKFEGPEEKKLFVKDLSAGKKSRVFVELGSDGNYTWQIKSCVDECNKEGTKSQCGDWSERISFEGYLLLPPKELTSGKEFYPEEDIVLQWKPIAEGTDCTQIRVFYKGGPKEKRRDCIEKIKATPNGYLVMEEIIEGKIGKINIERDLLPTSSETYRDAKTGRETNLCLGEFIYQVRFCTGQNCAKKVEECEREDRDCQLSANCQEAGEWSLLSTFELVTEKSPPRTVGVSFGTCKNMIPCQKCQFSDVPRIISNIIGCILWTLSPIACIVLLVYTGIGIYFSLGSSEAIERAKNIWKAVGIGWVVMLFSWTIVNLIGKILKLPGWY